MADGNYDLERSFWRAVGTVPTANPSFEDVWPTETRGDGMVRPNNKRTGQAQGKASFIRKARCRLCGFPNDLVRVDHTGGSIDGNGAGGAVTTSTQTAKTTGTDHFGNVVSHTENVGTQVASNGAGCALCFSKNSSKQRGAVDAEPTAWERIQPLGF